MSEHAIMSSRPPWISGGSVISHNDSRGCMLPEQMRQRRELSDRYLEGSGFEVGPHEPLWTNERATVRYVDRLDVAGLASIIPNLPA